MGINVVILVACFGVVKNLSKIASYCKCLHSCDIQLLVDGGGEIVSSSTKLGVMDGSTIIGVIV